MNDLIIIGASGFGREVAWLVERINKVKQKWNLLGFLDDNPDIQKEVINGYPVLGGLKDAEQFAKAHFTCAIGAAQIRENVISRLRGALSEPLFACLIDPSVEMSEFVKIGKGSIVCAHSIITVNVDIGAHVIINLDCTVGHDAVLNDFVTLYPSVNVSGLCTIGTGCELGTGMQIIQGLSIGDHSIIGAGAVVVKDIPAKCTAVGSPARPIKYFQD